MEVNTKVKHCFICLKQCSIDCSSKKLVSPLKYNNLASTISDGDGNPSRLYSQFITFVQKYLLVSVGDDNREFLSFENICDECSTLVHLIWELWQELCSVELRLSSKLEELGRLMKNSKLEEVEEWSNSFRRRSQSHRIAVTDVDEVRDSIIRKCFQKFEEINTGCIQIDGDDADGYSQGRIEDQEIKTELESLPSDHEDDGNEGHEVVNMALKLLANARGKHKTERNENEGDVKPVLDPLDFSLDDNQNDDNYEDKNDGSCENGQDQDPLEMSDNEEKERNESDEEVSDSDMSFQEEEEDDGDAEFQPENSDEMESSDEEEVEFVKTPQPSSSSSQRRRSTRETFSNKKASTIARNLNSKPLPTAKVEYDVATDCLCQLCGKLYETVAKLYRHLIYHEEMSPVKTLKCDFCSKEFAHEETRTLHIHRSHSKVISTSTRLPTFTCDDNRCLAIFTSQKDLNSHLETHSKPESIHYCSECEAGFLLPEYLDLHKLTHLKRTKENGKDNFHCPFPSCASKLYYMKDLQAHYNTKHGISLAIHNCGKCKLSFSSDVHLNSHLKKHNESTDPSKPLEEPEPSSHLAPPLCSACGLQFLRLKSLDNHRKTVHNLGVECPICFKIISDRSWLTGHIKSMHTPKPDNYIPKKHGRPKSKKYFPCGVCDKVFHERPPRKEHWKTAHPPKKKIESPCVCDICGRSFRFTHSLTYHKKYGHGPHKRAGSNEDGKKDKVFMCHTCGRGYANKSCLEKHEKEHATGGGLEKKKTKRTFLCHLCPQKYSTNQRLRYHLRGVHGKVKGEEFTSGEGPPKAEWKCLFPECFQEYFEEKKLKSHVKEEHSKEKKEGEFMCNVCGRVFTIQQSLKRHTVIHDEKKRPSCPVCHKTYSLMHTVKQHLLAVHGVGKEEGKIWPCVHCGGKFKTRMYLGMHVRKVHRVLLGKVQKKKKPMKEEKEEDDCDDVKPN
ncbi:unnamed protein product [Orchesella dallaii]|uniref:C2H2-type domain-containing protein n=1 Tax=Orchesella dallaii TaxID=48710 RepID=A0ABP1PS94_9HEXA